MKVVLLAVGSRGDVQPYVALGGGLVAAGHRVRLATHEPFRELVVGHDLEFAPLAGNPREVLSTPAGQAFLRSAANPVAFVRGLHDLGTPLAEEGMASSLAACKDAEAIVYSSLAFAGYHIAQARGVPSVAAFLQPNTPTAAFPSVLAPPRLRLGGFGNRLSHVAVAKLFYAPVNGTINRWRTDVLGLPRLSTGKFFRQIRSEPVLYGFSPHVVPPPADWPPWHHVTGYWFLGSGDAGSAPLEEFIGAGPPPVFVGFGSMRPQDPEAVTRAVLSALRRTGQRGVLQAGWGELGGLTGSRRLADDVLVVDEVPHDWLFPRMAAVVHHAGAGTTAAGLRAGVPTVAAPFFADQYFWGERVFRLGVGPAPVPQRRLNADRLTAALGAAVRDEGIRARAALLGARIRAERGVEAAVERFERAATRASGSR